MWVGRIAHQPLIVSTDTCSALLCSALLDAGWYIGGDDVVLNQRHSACAMMMMAMIKDG